MTTPPNIAAVSNAPQLEHPVHWVDTDQELRSLCARWRTLPIVAVDTEFMRSQTYYPKPALIQINDGAGNYLIDPLAIEDFEPFKELLLEESVVKVLHSCSEDLEVFQTLLGVVPVNLFDTQVAAAMVGLGFSMGYANLVQHVLQVELPKGETRSDWLQRPLSRAQTLYAAIDVEYLLVVAEKLRNELIEKDRLAWIEEDAANVTAALRNTQDPEQFYLRIKSAWKLRTVELAILQRLASWREGVAQRRDVPRNRVIKEHILFALAQQKPKHVGQLRQYEGMTERMIRADGDAIIRIIQEARESDPSTWPTALPKPLSPTSTAMMKRLKARVVALADELQVAPEVLLRKKDYEALVRAAQAAVRQDQPVDINGLLDGWRSRVIGPAVLEALTAAQPDVDDAVEADGNGADEAEGLSAEERKND